MVGNKGNPPAIGVGLMNDDMAHTILKSIAQRSQWASQALIHGKNGWKIEK